MATIFAQLVDPDNAHLDVTIRAKVKEWKALREFIQQHQYTPETGESVGQSEPFWSLIHRLGDVITSVEKQHSNYENR